MNNIIYVGNLAMEITEEDLRHNFSQFGNVLSVNIIKDNYTRLSKGFGFVEMETEQAAAGAIKRLNGYELCGRMISVNKARPKKDSKGCLHSSWARRGAGHRRRY